MNDLVSSINLQSSLGISAVTVTTTADGNSSTSSSTSSSVSLSSIVLSYPVTVYPLFGGDRIFYNHTCTESKPRTANVLFTPIRVMLSPQSWPSLCGPMPNTIKRQVRRYQSTIMSYISNDIITKNSYLYQLPLAFLLSPSDEETAKTKCSLTELMNNVNQINYEMSMTSTAAALVSPLTMLILPNDLLYDNNTYSAFDFDYSYNLTGSTVNATFVFLHVDDIQNIVTDIHSTIKNESMQQPIHIDDDDDDDDDNNQQKKYSTKSILHNAHFGGENSMDFMYSMALTVDTDHDGVITIDDYILFSTRNDTVFRCSPSVTPTPIDTSQVGSVLLSPSPTLVLSGVSPNMSPSRTIPMESFGNTTTTTNWLAIYVSIFWVLLFCCLLRTHIVTLRLLREAQKLNRLILHPDNDDGNNEYDVRSVSTGSTVDTQAEVWSRASL